MLLLPPPTALALQRQADTFDAVQMRTHLGHPVPVFSFRQPERLSHAKLPFSLALSADVDPTGLVEIAAEPSEAADSWFPDYSWSHYVLCEQAEGRSQHLGWRFDRKPHAATAGPPSFVALIVRSDADKAREGAGAAAEREAEALMVGIEAPAWLAAMAAALSARARSH